MGCRLSAGLPGKAVGVSLEQGTPPMIRAHMAGESQRGCSFLMCTRMWVVGSGRRAAVCEV